MKKIFWFLLIFLSPVLLFAQINESDTLDFKADLNISGFYQGGNVETIIFRAQSGISYKIFKNWLYKTQNSYVYQEFGKSKADEDILSLNFLYLNPSQKNHPLALGFVSTNFRRQIDLRYLVGGGYSFQVFEKEKDYLRFSITSEYEQTNFRNANFNRSEYDGQKIIRTFRGTIWISGKYHFFDKKLILNHESYYQPSLEKGNNYRWQASVGVNIPITNYLSFTTNYRQTFESIVIQGQKQGDRFLTFGVTVKSYE
jgi:hypothetical protein